ncbi:hypothetical protein [Komagataeibacter swingsii]|uniref:Uncharacterized protein n=1 Tax=Komagataeibacter swingsii TaxID=215220 RepID=A0A2V4REP4_9PROT|nr:hypothetical protein [Komagataeibacter swingsii]PYD68486.1 hypothetical protein CFR76_14785 [Komagataeibacter swingsii]GBQ58268.1 hypothetical protein AA16373_1225 [Komagataeibacter swingsii DSM 16373]
MTTIMPFARTIPLPPAPEARLMMTASYPMDGTLAIIHNPRIVRAALASATTRRSGQPARWHGTVRN